MAMRPSLRSFQFNTTDLTFLLQQINFQPLFHKDGTPVIAWDGTSAVYDATGASIFDPGPTVIVPGSTRALANIQKYGSSFASLTDIAGLRDVRGNLNNLNPGQATWGAVDQPFLRTAKADYANYTGQVLPTIPPAGGHVTDTLSHPFASALDTSLGPNGKPLHNFHGTPVAATPDYAVNFRSQLDPATGNPVVNAHMSSVVDATPRMISATITTGGVQLVKDAQNHIVFWDPALYAAGGAPNAPAAALAYRTFIDTYSTDTVHHLDTSALVTGMAIVDTTVQLQTGQASGGVVLLLDAQGQNVVWDPSLYATGATAAAGSAARVYHDLISGHSANGSTHIDITKLIKGDVIVDTTTSVSGAVTATGDANLYSGAGYGLLSVTGQHDKQNTDGNNITGHGNHEYFYGNIASIAGNAPNNGWFVLFGQFFDHGLDFIDKSSGYTITIPLATTDPLYGVIGPDGKPTTSITIVRATVAGQDTNGNASYVNHTSPYIDQSQTYGSHADVTQILRDWVQDPNHPGTWTPGSKLLDGHQTQAYTDTNGVTTTATLPTLNELRAALKTEGMRADLTWEDVTQNLRHRAADGSIAHDAAGNEVLTGDVLLRDMNPHFDVARLGSAAGLAAMATLGLTFDAAGQLAGGLGALAPYINFADFSINKTMYGAPGTPLTLAQHNAVSELLLESVGDHYIAGDGRANENFGLTAVHHVWHEEHSFQVNNIEATIQSIDANTTLTDAANHTALDPNHRMLHDWEVAVTATGPAGPVAHIVAAADGVPAHYEDARGNYTDAAGTISWDQEKMFQAAKLTVEMEYQHIAVDQYSRAVTPDIQEFAGYASDKNAAVSLEYSQAAFRFGHSTLRETIDTMDPKGGITGKIMSYALEEAFVNPAGFAKLGAGSIVLGMERQLMNEVDQFVTPALSQGLLGQPLDLGAINIARGRDVGLPTLNAFKAKAGLGKVYVDWSSFQANMMHPERIADFIAAYSLDGDTTRAQVIVDVAAGNTLDAGETAYVAAHTEVTAAYAHSFMHGGVDATTHVRLDNGGVDKIDLWIGGLAEVHVAGGVLGETFNAIFVNQIESLMDGDRFYYLQRLINQDFGNEIQNQQFKDIIERNTGVSNLNGNVFTYADAYYEMGKNARVATADLYDPSKATDLYRDHVKVFDGSTNTWVSADHTSTNLFDLWGNSVVDLFDASHVKVFDAATLTWTGGLAGVTAAPTSAQGIPLFFADGTYLGADQHKDGQLVAAHASDLTFVSPNGDGLGGTSSDQGLGIFTGDDATTAHNGQVSIHHITLKLGDDTTPDAPVVTFDENFIYDARPSGTTKNLDGSIDTGANSAEVLVGTKYNDYIEMGIGDDTAYGGDGNDIIYGGVANAGHNTLYGGAGNDYLVGGDAPDLIDGGAGDDWIFGMSSGSSVNGVDQLIGGDGNDHIYGGIGIDKMFGGKGDDYLYGGSDTDPFMYGGDGNDYMNGGSGQDILFGGNGSDIIDGGAGVDLLYGGNGDDFLRPGPGVSDIAGNGGGGDVLIGGDGVTDTGFDFADYSQQMAAGIQGDLANQGNAAEVASLIHVDKKTGGLIVAATQGTVWFQLEGIIGTGTDDRLLGDSPADASAAAVSHGDNWLVGGSGDDIITGRGGNDVIVGGSIRLARLIGTYVDQHGVADPYTSEVDGASHRVADTSVLGSNGLLDLGAGDGVTFEKHFQELLKSAAYKNHVLGDNFDWLRVDTAARALVPFSDSVHDTAVYSGPLYTEGVMNYKITSVLENGVTVAYRVHDKIEGRDGTDLVIGVESLKFADQTITLHAAPKTTDDNFAAVASATGSTTISGNILVNDVPQAAGVAQTTLTASMIGQAPQHGSVSLQSNGSFVYTANAGYVGRDYFIYQASDGYAQSNPTLVTLNVDPLGTAVASPDSFDLVTVNEPTPNGPTPRYTASGSVLANDFNVGGGVLHVTAVNNIALGSGTGPTTFATSGRNVVQMQADGTFIYTFAKGNPNTLPPGAVDTFAYTVTTATPTASSDVAVATIHLRPDTGPSLATVVASGTVADGYISGATVYADTNGNGVMDPGEASGATDANGAYALKNASGTLHATGGKDVSTNLPFAGEFEAPEGSKVISPLTTLVTLLGGVPGDAKGVDKAFGFTGTDLTQVDPVAATLSGTPSAKALFLAGATVADEAALISSALAGLGVSHADAYHFTMEAIATQVRLASLKPGATVDLAATNVINAIVRDSAGYLGKTVDAVFTADIVKAVQAGNIALHAHEAEDGPTLLTNIANLETDIQGAASTTLENAHGVHHTVTANPKTDAQVLHGTHDQYLLVCHNGAVHVQDIVAGRDGSLVLTGLPTVTFTDGIAVMDPNGTASDVARLYQAALNRTPDAAGLNAWTDRIDISQASLVDVASSFIHSPEFIQTYGSLSDQDFVQQLYQNTLHRPGDADGAHYWQNALASGAGRGEVLLNFAESPESRTKMLSIAGDKNDAEAARLYQALGRTPDQSGQSFWSSALANGTTSSQVAQGFISSPEFAQQYGGLNEADFISALYQNVLHRAPDAAGSQFWAGTLQPGDSRASVLVGFADSMENRMQTAGATHDGWVFACG